LLLQRPNQMMKRTSSDWLLRLAWACPIVIFVCMLIGWRLSNRLYTDVDGAFGRWNFEYAFEWGHWFDLAIFNPFAGLGSTFWSNTPWLNPGAWALQLPFSPLATVTLSYLAQLAAYALTLYWLGRAAGVSRLAAVYALGLFIVFNLPPFNYFWGFITPYPIAPFLLVTAAAGNLILLSLIIAAEPHDRLWLAKALAAGLAGLVWGIYASVTYFVFDLLIIIGFLVVLLLCSFRQPARCGRLLLVAAVLTVAFAASGMWGYLDALRAISGRGGPQFSQLIIGMNELVFDEKVRSAFLARALGGDGVLTFWCERPGSPLPSCASPAGVLLLLPILLCSYAVITKNMLFRAMLLSCLLLQLGVWFLMAKAAVGIALINLSVGLIATSSALTFLIFPYMINLDRLQRRVERLRDSIEGGIALAPETALDPARGRLAGLALCALAVVPAGAAMWITYFYVMRDPNVSPPVITAILHGDYKGDAETPIVRRLRQEIGLSRGSEFRGVAATYLGNDLAMEHPFGKGHRYAKIWNSELFFRWVTGNAHQNTGLWTFGIPTYDHYAHGITKPLMTFTAELLTDRKTQFWVNMIRAYELVPDLLRMLGVRFVLSDAAIDMPGFTEVEHIEVTGEGTPIRPEPPVNLFLYELAGANRADWSPVDATVVKGNRALMDALRQHQASLRERVFLSSDPPRPLTDLVAMRQGRLSFDRNEFRFQGEAAGWSLALLPLQFSHCWSQTGKGDPDVHLLRANYLLTGLLFKGTVDVRYKFDFGPWRSQCRVADGEMHDGAAASQARP
jgi:hypothetical protein